MKPVTRFLLNNNWLILLLLAWSCTGNKNTTTGFIERGQLMFVDQSDNGFVLRGGRSLIKYDFRNRPTNRYDFDFSVSKTGLSTDLRIYAFNPDFQSFYILDRYLNEITHFSFNEHFDFLVSHPILANGQNIWLYNENENKIQKYTSQLRFLNESRNLNWEIPGFRIDQLLFHNNEVYLIDYRKGVFIFDYSGRLRKHIPTPILTRPVQIDHSMSRIFAYFSNQWNVSDPDRWGTDFRPVIVPESTENEYSSQENFIFQNGKIYLWNIHKQEIEVIRREIVFPRSK